MKPLRPKPQLLKPKPLNPKPRMPGLGRLTYDIAKLGFSAQGCEFSYQMLIASNYILNYAPGKETIAIHPWALSSSNVWDAQEQQLKQVTMSAWDTEFLAFGRK